MLVEFRGRCSNAGRGLAELDRGRHYFHWAVARVIEGNVEVIFSFLLYVYVLKMCMVQTSKPP
jgi:hypothetical protein